MFYRKDRGPSLPLCTATCAVSVDVECCARAGELPGYRLGSNVLRFSAVELDAWLEAHCGNEPRQADPA